MTTIAIGALLIGLTLGLLGSGGSTVTVPVLVYLVGHSAKISIAESMAIVGLISIAAAIPYARGKAVDWRSVIYFGIPGMVGTFVGAWLGGLTTGAVQLVVFGVVLIIAAAFMFRKAFGKNASDPDQKIPRKKANEYTVFDNFKIGFEGIAVGVLTGFVGVGGGFLIVPALVMLAKLPVRLAIGTSLVIIALKSAVGFAKYQQALLAQGLSVDWQTVFLFSIIGIVGCLAGQQVNSRLNQRALQQVFAVFLVIVGIFVVVREGNQLINHKPTESAIEATAS